MLYGSGSAGFELRSKSYFAVFAAVSECVCPEGQVRVDRLEQRKKIYSEAKIVMGHGSVCVGPGTNVVVSGQYCLEKLKIFVVNSSPCFWGYLRNLTLLWKDLFALLI